MKRNSNAQFSFRRLIVGTATAALLFAAGQVPNSAAAHFDQSDYFEQISSVVVKIHSKPKCLFPEPFTSPDWDFIGSKTHCPFPVFPGITDFCWVYPGLERNSIVESDQVPDPVNPWPQLPYHIGFLNNETGFVVTNAHAIKNRSHFQVELPDGRLVTACSISSDEETGFAVLRINDGYKLPFGLLPYSS